MSLPQPETDPRLAIRADLLAASRRRMAKRRRRRGIAIATISITGMLGAAAGAATIGNQSTGVPVLDEVLAISAERNHAMTPSQPVPGSSEPILPTLDIRPGPGNVSAPLTLPAALPSQSGTGIGAAYVSRDDFICFVLVGSERRPDRGGVGCTAPQIVDHWLDERPAAIATGGGYDVANVAAIVGFARADVEDVHVNGLHGPVKAVLGGPWRPGTPGVRTLRPFVAIVEYPAGPRGPLTVGNELTVTLTDGSVQSAE